MDRLPHVPIIILAAGFSRRMGQPKPLLELGGKHAIERILDTCRTVNTGPIIVVLGAEADQIEEAADLSDTIVVRNPAPEKGRTSSIKVGLDHLPKDADAFFIWPVDMPLVHFDTVIQLVDSFDRNGTPQAIIVPVHEWNRGHPILIGAGLRDEVYALGDDQPLRDLVQANPERVMTLEVNDPTVLWDMNTPEDYQRLKDKVQE